MYELNLLSALLHNERYIKDVGVNIFQTTEISSLYSYIRAYHTEYGHVPIKDNLARYMELKKASDDLYSFIDDIYISREDGLPIEEIKSYVREKKIEDLVIRVSVMDNPVLFQEELEKILRYVEGNEYEPLFLTTDHFKTARKELKTHPTYLQSLNRIMGAGGMYSPQLVIFLGDPKSFKSGMMINLCIGFMRNGLKGVYIDFENSKEEILIRTVQSTLNASRNEVVKLNYFEEADKIFKRLKQFGGELAILDFPAYATKIKDVNNFLKELKLSGYDFDYIIWDYLDLVDSDEKTLTDTKRIQQVYHGVKNINKEHGVFSISVSQMGRSHMNVSKQGKFDLSMIAADFGKIMNADAGFAILRNDEDLINKTAQIIAGFQRQGSNYDRDGKYCPVYIDESLQYVAEIFEHETGIYELPTPVDEKFGKDRLNYDAVLELRKNEDGDYVPF